MSLIHDGLPKAITKELLLDALESLGRKVLKLTPTAFALLRHAVRVAAKEDFQRGRICGNWEQVQDLARHVGATVRAINFAEAQLEERGYIQRTAAGNGYRRVLKVNGCIHRLWGISIGPLIDKAEGLLAQFHDRQFERKSMDELRTAIGALRRQINQSEHPDAQAKAEALLPGGRVSRITKPDQLRALEAALSEVVEQIGAASRSENFADRPEEIADLNTESNESKICTAGRSAMADLKPATAVAFASEDYRLVVTAMGGPSWPNVVEASSLACRRIGIDQSTWQRACDRLGRVQAAMCVMVIDRNQHLPVDHPYRARSPGRCLAGMLRRAPSPVNLWGMMRAVQSAAVDPLPAVLPTTTEPPPMASFVTAMLARIEITATEYCK
jgi:DNA-binding MarR family transcriptional regulator